MSMLQHHLHAGDVCRHIAEKRLLVHWQIVQVPLRTDILLATSSTTAQQLTQHTSIYVTSSSLRKPMLKIFGTWQQQDLSYKFQL